MSAAFIRSDYMRKLVSVVCLLALPAAAQQSNVQPAGARSDVQVSVAASDQPGGTQAAAAALPSAPAPQNLPEPTRVDYSKPRAFFPNPLARYAPRDVPPPVFTNTPRIRDLVKNGKIMLSLDDAISIALVDNLDIAIARYTMPIADTDILRTKAGGLFQGVN